MRHSLLSDSFQDWRGETPDLMKPQARTASGAAQCLRARLGEHAIWSLGLGQWEAELANQYQPQRATASLEPPTYQPGRLGYCNPLAISPHEFEQIQVLRGPERIEAHWWQDQGARRDYHVADKNGALVWIFRTCALANGIYTDCLANSLGLKRKIPRESHPASMLESAPTLGAPFDLSQLNPRQKPP